MDFEYTNKKLGDFDPSNTLHSTDTPEVPQRNRNFRDSKVQISKNNNFQNSFKAIFWLNLINLKSANSRTYLF